MFFAGVSIAALFFATNQGPTVPSTFTSVPAPVVLTQDPPKQTAPVVVETPKPVKEIAKSSSPAPVVEEKKAGKTAPTAALETPKPAPVVVKSSPAQEKKAEDPSASTLDNLMKKLQESETAAKEKGGIPTAEEEEATVEIPKPVPEQSSAQKAEAPEKSSPPSVEVPTPSPETVATTPAPATSPSPPPTVRKEAPTGDSSMDEEEKIRKKVGDQSDAVTKRIRALRKRVRDYEVTD